MSRYKAYSAYKDSGVEWLESIPNHWKVKKLKFIANVQPSNIDKKTKDGEIPVVLCNYTDVYYNDTIDKSMDFMKASATEEQISKFTLRAGDTVITKDSEDPNDIAIPTFVSEDMLGVICGYHLSIIRPHEITYGAYIKRVFECGYARAYFSTRSNGLTRYGLGTYVLNNVFYPKPPEKEAATIASFLDHETAKINTLIKKQQQLIKLLKEKRQAVISHAVTKGLNPNAPMRDSGIEWLGEIPEHWTIKPIKQLAELNPKKSEINSKKCLTCNFIPMEKLKTGVVLLDEVRFISDVYDGYTYFENDDILIAKVTPCFENHNIAIVRDLQNSIGFGSTEIFVLRVKLNISNGFLFYRLQENNFMDIATAAMTGAGGLKRVPSDVFNNYLIAIPNILEDQEKIANYISMQTTRIDNLIEKANSAIELMKERRTALISAAVTGKIDVRNWQPPEAAHSSKKINKECNA